MLMHTRTVVSAIKSQQGIPSLSTLRRDLHTSHRNVAYALEVDSLVRGAWRRKVLREAAKLPLSMLLSKRGSISLRHARTPEVFDHVRRRILQRIRTFNGRPSLAHLARHVAGKRAGRDFLGGDKIIRKAANSRLLAILKQMTPAEIREKRLNRNAVKISPEARRHIAWKMRVFSQRAKRG